MTQAQDQGMPVKAKAFLVDPASLRVIWLNESACEALLDRDATDALTVEHVMPMAGQLGMPALIRRVAEDGEPAHLRTDVISTHRGSMGIAASVYRLPGGEVLVISEHAWENAGKSSSRAEGAPRRRR